MPYGTVNADTLVTSTSGGILGAGNASIMKNRIINGAMVIDQRNSGASGTSNGFTVDRFAYYGTQSSKLTWQQNAGAVTPPVGFTNYLGFTSSSAYSVTSTDEFIAYQNIEGYNMADLGWGTTNAKTITMSFWVRSSLTGTFGGVLRNSVPNRVYAFTYSIPTANTWTQISVTITGDTSGTWQSTNSTGIAVIFGLGQGSSQSITAGSWGTAVGSNATGATSVVGTNGATFYITGVQLEVGSSATGFEYRQYGTELALCQRYYEKFNYDTQGSYDYVAPCSVNNSTNVIGAVYWKTIKRANPTITTSAASSFRVNLGGNTDNVCVAITTSYADVSYAQFSWEKTGGGMITGYSAYVNRQLAVSPCFVAASSEL